MYWISWFPIWKDSWFIIIPNLNLGGGSTPTLKNGDLNLKTLVLCIGFMVGEIILSLNILLRGLNSWRLYQDTLNIPYKMGLLTPSSQSFLNPEGLNIPYKMGLYTPTTVCPKTFTTLNTPYKKGLYTPKNLNMPCLIMLNTPYKMGLLTPKQLWLSA